MVSGLIKICTEIAEPCNERKPVQKAANLFFRVDITAGTMAPAKIGDQTATRLM